MGKKWRRREWGAKQKEREVHKMNSVGGKLNLFDDRRGETDF